jgi:hypothetical protein
MYFSNDQIDIDKRMQVEDLLDEIFPNYDEQHVWLSTFNIEFNHTPFWMIDNQKYEELFNYLSKIKK